jgi:hypothetical protein
MRHEEVDGEEGQGAKSNAEAFSHRNYQQY